MKDNKKKIITIAIILIAIVVIILGTIGVISLTKKAPSNDKTPNKENNNSNNSNNNQVIYETTVYENKENNTYDKETSFLLAIEDIIDIENKGTTVIGTVERGEININEEVDVVGFGPSKKATIKSIDKEGVGDVKSAQKGDRVSITLKNTAIEELSVGQVLAKENTIEANYKFTAEIHVLNQAEIGEAYLFDGGNQQFYFRTTEVSGIMTLPGEVKRVTNDETATINVELETGIAMEEGTTFTIRFGDKVLATGTITKVN